MVDAKKQEEKTESPTVYSAALWWRDCDPFLQVVGLDAAEVEKTALEAMADAAKECFKFRDAVGPSTYLRCSSGFVADVKQFVIAWRLSVRLQIQMADVGS